jgi:hypothetical protein
LEISERRYHYFYFAILMFLFVLLLKAESAKAAFNLPGGIDSGASTSYTTVEGVTFEADYGRSGGIARTSSGDIAGTEDDDLYHSRVVARTGTQFSYRITPSAGVTKMQIIGHFNEHYHKTANARLIDVFIRCAGSAEPWNTGKMVEEELDIFSAAGNANTALLRNWGTVDVSGGEVEIIISASSTSPDAALICAIEFAEVSPDISDIQGLPTGIDAGASTSYTNAQGVTFEADYGRSGGIVRTSSGEIAGTEDDTLYHSRVVAQIGSQITYRITPPSDLTEMQIKGHFNEHYHQSADARLIDVTIRCLGSSEPWNTGKIVEEELDIFSKAGGTNKALVRDWGTVDVSGGEVEIIISASSISPDAALISALEFSKSEISSNGFDTPTLVSPKENKSMDNGCNGYFTGYDDPLVWNFSWTEVSGTASYQILILKDGEEFITDTVSGTDYTYYCFHDSEKIPECMLQDPDENTWTWQVRAGGGNTWSEWSEERAFNVDVPEVDCVVDYPFMVSQASLEPTAPADLSPGDRVSVKFTYWTPYAQEVYISLIPQSDFEPSPDYVVPERQLYPAAYDGSVIETYFEIHADNVQVDEIMVLIEPKGTESKIMEYIKADHYFGASSGQ